MSATTVPTEIAAFAARVRAELADLSAEELDELTEGLEADLSEAYAEDLARELPDPVAYAAELRRAAGLPGRAQPEVRRGWSGAFASLGDGLRETGRDVLQTLRRNPASRAALDFLGTLRPVWWVARAWVAAWLLSAFFGGESGFLPTSPFWFLVTLGLVVTSVQWGRGEWGAPRLLPLLVVGNLVAAVLVLPVVAMAADASTYSDPYAYAMEPTSEVGLRLGGETVTNIYPYGPDGEPLEGVQLFDQSGRPLLPALDPAVDECIDEYCTVAADGTASVAEELVTGQEAGNVFPLSFVTYLVDAYGQVARTPSTDPQVPAAPFVKVPALASADEAPADSSADGAERDEDAEKVSP